MYKQKDLLLVPVPFSDLSSKKSRPVIVISNDKYNRTQEDVLVASVTSSPKDEFFSILLSNESMDEGKLPLPSRVRCDKLYSLSAKIVRQRYGKIKQGKFHELQKGIQQFISEIN